MFPAYKVANLEINPGLVLAPMSGVTCSAFRRLIKESNPGCVGLVMTEFISVEALTRRVAKSIQMMRFDASERPVAIQIFGHDIDRMRDAAIMAEQTGADIVDINCGCPAPKVVRKGGGCELMRQPQHLQKILREVRSAIRCPLTLKTRLGWDDSNKNAGEIAKIAQDEGVDAIAIHGRTRTQAYRGEADWSMAYSLKQSLSIPVLGSGDVADKASALKKFYAESNQSRVSGLLIGRAALKNPMIFNELQHNRLQSPSRDARLALRLLSRYVELLLEETSERAALGKIKQIASQMCRGHSWRIKLLLATSLQQQLLIIGEETARLDDLSTARSTQTVDPSENNQGIAI